MSNSATPSEVPNSTTSCPMTTAAKPANDPRVEQYRVFAYSSYLVLTLIALLLYGLFLKIFYGSYKQHFSQHTFYVLVQHLAVCDIGYLVENLVICVPYVYMGRNVFPGVLHDILCAGNTLFFFSITGASLLITVNRMSHFLFRSVHRRLFTRPAIYGVSACIWVFGVTTVVVSTAGDCPKDFTADRYHFLYRCAKGRSGLQKTLMSGMFLVPAVVGVAIVAGNCVLFAHIRLLNRRVSGSMSAEQQKVRSSQERRLLLQGALIGGSLVVENLCFNYFPGLFAGSPLGPILMNWSGILNSMLTPVIFLAFNKTVRNEMWRTFGVHVNNEATEASQSGVKGSRKGNQVPAK